MSGRPAYIVAFLCFFVSGFCSLLYQVLWTRLAFAHFGIITPVLSVVVSVFMLGLGVGSAFGGRFAAFAQREWRVSPILVYAAAEAVVAAGAFVVPAAFAWWSEVLLRVGAASSFVFLLLSAIGIAMAILPWCVAMGATFPLMMNFVRGFDRSNDDSFSFLYAANVLGATAGAAATALVLIELFGLHGTSLLGAAGNVLIAAIAAAAGIRFQPPAAAAMEEGSAANAGSLDGWGGWVLFVTGFSSLGLEVCWARDFTFSLLTTIYAFGAILATYLISTFAGSVVYRWSKRRGVRPSLERGIAWLFPLALLPVIIADPLVDHHVAQTLLSIVPLCGLLGFVTPGIIDRFGGGDGTRAGRFYALNIAGGVAGPLAAGYVLLPLLGLRWAMIVLALPLAAAFFGAYRREWRRAAIPLAISVPIVLTAVFVSRAYDEASLYPAPHEVRRDYSASAVAFGSGMNVGLWVNAIPITNATTETKVMAHLPLAIVERPARALDICFGMGTTFRSLTTWGVETTAVDISSSVIDSFGFFHPDAPRILADPRNRTVVDDGRRYLLRTNASFDVVTVDPPPPVEAAGSSLLYSTQFYEIVKRRLAPGGVLAQWLPPSETRVRQSVSLALQKSFRYVRAFQNDLGTHFLASTSPIFIPPAAELVRRMPAAARRDLVEWEDGKTSQQVAARILSSEVPMTALLPPAGSTVPALTDDVPYNEYFFMRRYLAWPNP